MSSEMKVDRRSPSDGTHAENDRNDGSGPNNRTHLHPHDTGNSSSPNFSRKKGSSASQSSLDFGRGEKALAESSEMLKHATTGGSQRQGSASGPSGGSSGPSGSASSSNTNSSKAPPEPEIGHVKLPQRFVVKYLGFRETSNIWGIKYTRRPVDEMVNEAKRHLTTNPEKALALVKMDVTEEGILVGPMPQNINPDFPNGKFAIESISYGVQDLVYTRVFAMIVVKSDGAQNVKLSQLAKDKGAGDSLPFRCHAFVCDSRTTARRLTYSLASAFEIFSKKVSAGSATALKPKKFAIDLRTPEEMEAASEVDVDETEA